jgi:hypothetical protein
MPCENQTHIKYGGEPTTRRERFHHDIMHILPRYISYYDSAFALLAYIIYDVPGHLVIYGVDN